ENYYFVAVSPSASIEGKLIGFVGGAIREEHGHISGLAVDKEYRRSGVGKGLIKAVEQEFLTDAFERVTLEVRKSNRDARRFYEKLGYKPSYTVRGYYA
ncbi:MAG: GNAT family N-acetyltransferase, partial [archaeon]|nr:GNAT family N-acetyltransferase [archaeon]